MKKWLNVCNSLLEQLYSMNQNISCSKDIQDIRLFKLQIAMFCFVFFYICNDMIQLISHKGVVQQLSSDEYCTFYSQNSSYQPKNQLFFCTIPASNLSDSALNALQSLINWPDSSKNPQCPSYSQANTLITRLLVIDTQLTRGPESLVPP